uniref:Putative reverse transcriptase domain-containing protein n=1 Tax=Tanacetum cinerariifolium TaxID=118510 RepID=A0A6L2J972_TANCI|nr:putative reverse transcriptase domain-containing protein [Tanacetum cinerariifolium]
MEFEVGDIVMLKVSPWKGVIRFGKRGKLSPWYVGPFKIIERIGPVAYKLELPKKLYGIHNTFYVSSLKKFLEDKNLVIPLEEIKLDDKLHLIKEPVEIMDREFKKPGSPKLSTIQVSPEEPTRKSKRVKRSTKKSTNAPTTSIVIRETPMMSLSKKKENVTIKKRKGTNLLFEVALTEEAQYKEVQKKSLRDFHKTHPSGSGVLDVTKEESSKSEAESWRTDEDDNNNDHDSMSEGGDQESDNEENKEDVEDDEEEKDDEFVKTAPNSTNDEDETNVKDKAECDEDKGMDYTTNQFDDDVDVRLNEPVNTDEGLIQKEGIDAEMINVQQGNENLEITLNQVVEDNHIFPPQMQKFCIYSIIILQSLPSFIHPPQQSTPTPPPTTEATNPLSALLNFASVFQFNNRVSALEKVVVELKNYDLLNTRVTALVDEQIHSRLGATIDEFMSYLLASITARITKQVNIQLPQILPKEVSNFAPSMIKNMVTGSLEHAVLANVSSQPKSTYEVVALLTEFELKKILIDKIDESQSYLTATEHRECYDGLIKSYDLDKNPSTGSDRGLKKRKTSKDDEPTKEEPEFEVADFEMPQDQEENLGDDDEEPKRKTPQQGPTQSWLMTLAYSADKPSKTFDELMSTFIDFSVYIMNDLKITNLTQETLLGPAFKLFKGTRTNFTELEYDFEECYKALSKKIDWENPEGGDYPFDLTKPLPLVMNGNRQTILVDYFFNNDLKYLTANVYQKHGYSKKSRRSLTGSRKLPEEDQRRNRLMRSDELYKFSDGTLTGIQSSLDDITKNIQMEYLP